MGKNLKIALAMYNHAIEFVASPDCAYFHTAYPQKKEQIKHKTANLPVVETAVASDSTCESLGHSHRKTTADPKNGVYNQTIMFCHNIITAN